MLTIAELDEFETCHSKTPPDTEGAALSERMIGLLVDNDGINITIKSAEDLAERMAKKARFFADVIFRALEDKDDAFEIADGSLAKQFQSFQKILIGDISHAAFAGSLLFH